MSHIRPPTPATASAFLLACTDLNLPAISSLLAAHPTLANTALDPDTNRSALHIAIDALDKDASEEKTKAAEETVRLCLLNGAVWNELDANDETPGCISYRKGLTGCYEMMVQAGLRAEVLLARLGGWETLGGGTEGESDEDQDEALESVDPVHGDAAPTSILEPKPSTLSDDVTAEQYLSSKLTYSSTALLDSSANGVMMEWERNIMLHSVSELLPHGGENKRVLNVGFGMGIIDTAFQAALSGPDSKHYIVEPHPDVLAHMRTNGWFTKPNVTVLEGRWQDVLPALVASGDVSFDAVYFDTFAEPYAALKTFFNEVVIALLEASGKFGFFHGLGADRRISYDVYTRVLEMDLFEAGLEVTWKQVEIRHTDAEKMEQATGKEVDRKRWEGTRRRYWDVGDVYMLPVCEFLGGVIEL